MLADNRRDALVDLINAGTVVVELGRSMVDGRGSINEWGSMDDLELGVILWFLEFLDKGEI